MKRIALVILAALMSFSVLFSLTACLPNNEKIIRDALTTELDQFKDPNSEAWETFAKGSAAEFQAAGIDAQVLIDAWAEGFSYEIGEISVEGDQATVAVTIHCKQYNDAANNAVTTLMADPTLADLTASEVEKKTRQTIVDELKKLSPKASTILTSFALVGNTWTEDSASATEYAAAIYGA